MGEISTKIEINIKTDIVYENLKERYNSQRFKNASLETKGYIPPIILKENKENSKLVFTSKGHDSLTKMKIGGWQWSYDLKELDGNRTEVIISYEWSLFMTIMSFFTVKHQAANELCETVLSLDALEQLNV